jgi:hypothetical protein
MSSEKDDTTFLSASAPISGTPIAPAWDLGSLIDLEVAVSQDSDEDKERLKRRDRDFFLHLKKQSLPSGDLLKSRSWVLWQWLQFRKPDLAIHEITPGDEVGNWIEAIKKAGLGLMALLGAIWVWGNLSRSEVNVVVFGFLTVGIPFILSCVGFWFLWSNRTPSGRPAPSIFRGLFAGLLIKCVKNGLRNGSMRASGDRVRTAKAAVGAIRIRCAERGGIVFSSLASATHLLGLGMVLGISVALFWFKTSSDQNYIWRSHAAWTNETTIGQGARLFALPWSPVFGEGRGYPSPAQIENTRAYRDGKAQQTDRTANDAWSSFLLLASLCWGVFPRLALYSAGRRALRKALTAETFTQHRFDDAWRRMTRPEVSIDHPTDRERPDEQLAQPGHSMEPLLDNVGENCILLIPNELNATELIPRIRTSLTQETGSVPTAIQPFSDLPSERIALLERIGKEYGQPAELLLLLQAFIPPTRALSEFLKQCRQQFPKASLRIALIGKVRGQTGWDAPSGSDHFVWNNFITAAGDPRLSINARWFHPNQ